MPSFKPDSSFFKKIVIGANGTRVICEDLNQHGHEMVELERGSTGTKLWKDVKRKRVRLPDLVCKKCGLRVEVRAKTKPDLSMSHSDTDQERSWDFGMLPDDLIAFPISAGANERLWTKGTLSGRDSYWHERDWIHWINEGKVNYFTVDVFRKCPPDLSSRKGVTEGSELTLTWKAKFATCPGIIESIADNRIKLRPSGGRVRTLNIPQTLPVHARKDQEVKKYQVLASGPPPLKDEQLACAGTLPDDFILKCLKSRERTLRFTGVKLSRMHNLTEHASLIAEMAQDPHEDLYVRLEGLAFLATIGKESIEHLFDEYLNSQDDQIRLESVITIGEIATSEAIRILGGVLHDNDMPYFLRSASAWALGNIGSTEAQKQLKKAFADVSWDIREEALEAITSLEQAALPVLLPGLQEHNDNIAAGCAEAIRQLSSPPSNLLKDLSGQLQGQSPPKWVVWLLGHLSSKEAVETLDKMKGITPETRYAVSLLWSFTHSWIARRWELQASVLPCDIEGD